MKLAQCRAKELAHRDEAGERSLRSEPIDTPATPRNEETQARPRNEVCPRSGPVTRQMANTPELEETL
jgi:hypothetical protein